MRRHRVGTVTLGSVLVIMGVLFLVHTFAPALTYTMIFRCWPLILIALGAEVLLAQSRSEKVEFTYDIWAVAVMILLVFFAMCMAAADVSLDWHFRMGY